MYGKRKRGVFFADRVDLVQSQLSGNYTVTARTWSNHNMVTIFVGTRQTCWTLPVQVREAYFLQWAHVESDPLAKNRIELQWGSKLPGTTWSSGGHTKEFLWNWGHKGQVKGHWSNGLMSWPYYNSSPDCEHRLHSDSCWVFKLWILPRNSGSWNATCNDNF